MPVYSVQFEGHGVSLTSPEGLARRFVVSVTLDASDEDAAEARARLDVYREWTAQGLRARAGGTLPDLAVTELGKVSSLRAPFADRGVSGFTFVPAA